MSDETGKGRKTPSRKEAEAARKAALRPTTDRKVQARRDREKRAALREKQQAALKGAGDDKFLPVRDRGPVRRFARDYVDRRRNVAEYLLPILVLVLIASLFPGASAIVAFGWAFTIVGTALDEVVLVRGLKKELKARFPETPTRGAVFYAVLRSSQLRRFRLPKPVVARNQPLTERY
ncbi:hypothetical protein ASD11_05070 [Aeromicrobium sp. Root495]|uniref:DUF3043 domain-containing protein n=1 Tax=Aeromicrobium sp. Root495 TaxID=1736550 RepID=UPI0006FBF20B|nr:DUF3043 domain-containing protein [Aeromicrobium sp. Root495]KQY58986.1 hypothetical protein ASD11_05070 [Aeromicrobium sp. Root495]